MERRRPAPERTCVGCRQRATKGDLLRVVKAPDGTLRVDPAGSAPGRGAYLHRDPDCVAIAIDRGGLTRALRTGACAEAAARLRAEIDEVVGDS
ncbi:MAG: YlxR family protein [Actinomycetota bacterium]